MTSAPPLRVMALCLGNICRSPVAEALLRRELEAAGVEAVVDSAGTGDWHVGRPADPRSIEVARQHGVRLRGKARQLIRRDFADYDIILAMDSQNAAEARALAGSPGAEARVRLMRDFDPQAPGADVPDPYLGGKEGFESMFELLERSAKEFAKWAAALQTTAQTDLT